MCKLGDIIVVQEFKDEVGDTVPKHSFVVVNDESDIVEGLKYDFVTNMLCSFHNDEHKSKKLRFKENLAIRTEYISGKNLNSKEGYIKADHLYYFNKNEIRFKIIAHMDAELLDELVQLILVLSEENKLKIITTNLKETVEI